MELIVDVKNLSKNFDGLTAVNDLSFSVKKGDVYGFLGQNGAGKSTTIRMLLGLVRASGGEINIFGKNLLHHKSMVLSRTGAIIERPDLYKYLTAYDHLAIFAKMSGARISRKQIMEKLEHVGLAARAGSKVKTFSQGMKQRLGLAVSLVHDPELIILDEPTNGLDPQGIAEMRSLIKSLSNDHGKTVIISSHLLNEIEQIANRMLIINNGSRIAEGDVSAMLDPSHSTVSLHTSDNIKAADVLRGLDYCSGLSVSENMLRFDMSRNQIPSLINLLSSKGIDIYSVYPRNSLEDFFLNLTNQNNYVEPAAN